MHIEVRIPTRYQIYIYVTVRAQSAGSESSVLYLRVLL